MSTTRLCCLIFAYISGCGVRGLVGLVVAEAPVADEVDHDVVTELLAVRERERARRRCTRPGRRR